AGAMGDASQAYRVGFYANPAEQPEIIDVGVGIGGTKVAAAQWTTNLALALNNVVAKVGRFDERFLPFSSEIFKSDIVDGDIIYRWRQPEGRLNFDKARVAKIRLMSLTAAGSGGLGIATHGILELTLGDWVHGYDCDLVSTGDWMGETMACLGEKILNDELFWKAVEATP
ncbi:MAG: hypothetical protein HY902_09655, partial [Deltaproteobacteria bacterium]|nr:hypothetical protein [Deltaproteobacteria bacterium]